MNWFPLLKTVLIILNVLIRYFYYKEILNIKKFILKKGGMKLDYSLSEEQKMFRQSVRRFAQEKVASLAEEIEESGNYPDELLQMMNQQGIMGLPYETKYNGGGGNLLMMCLAMEELASVCANTAMVPTTQELGAMPIVVGGSEEQKQKYLPKIASGESRISFALTEPEAGSDVASMRTKAHFDGRNYIVNGVKRFISYADVADVMCVFAKTKTLNEENVSAFIVDKNTPGITIGKKENKMGFRGFSSCEVYFENVMVPPENRLGEEGDGFKIAMKTLDKTRPLVGILAVGLAQGALDTAIAFTKERKQFGHTISQFQGLQWMMADMAMQIEAARQLVYKSAYVIDQGELGGAKYGAMAKCFATDVCMKVTTDAVQLLGGVGYMREFPTERYFRQAKLLQIVEGTNQIQRVVIANQLLK
ncbi:acyl-CoA dehydrogenase family protein [Alteribacillus sp. JSM 102045]|uniref:acyl-CoA dehydrogenase family protein n=1 Tax=Alteribacillus sp. JSM 102045 TaxID=1562101 RepID=UPI0035C04102